MILGVIISCFGSVRPEILRYAWVVAERINGNIMKNMIATTMNKKTRTSAMMTCLLVCLGGGGAVRSDSIWFYFNINGSDY